MFSATTKASNSAFSPINLFSPGIQGAWYDPSDITTLFQDDAGTTPVTAAGQSVGRMLDKSGRGNHATQANLAQRPIYAREPLTGRRNLLRTSVNTGNMLFQSGATLQSKSGTDPNGGNDHYRVRLPVNGVTRVQFGVPVANSASLAGEVFLRLISGNTNNLTVAFQGNAVISAVATRKNVAPNITTDWIKFTPEINATVGTGADIDNIRIEVVNLGGTEVTVEVAFPNVELNAIQGYQRVGNNFDVTEAGVPSLSYLSFDGSDDGMATGNIVPGTDKAQVFAGLRKLSGAGGVLVETSVNSALNDGTFGIFAPATASTYGFRSRGTSTFSIFEATPFTAPITNILTGLGDIAAPSAILRVDGVQAASSTATQGTGNYLTYPLFIGRRAGTSIPFNGRIYGLILRFGPNLTTDQITQTERWVAQRTGVTIP